MDDLKLYAANEMQLQNLLGITTNFSRDIRMEFGLDKCKTMHREKGKILGAGFCRQ